MTFEQFKKAEAIINQIDTLQSAIDQLQAILDYDDLNEWRVEVRRNASSVPWLIDAYGHLEDFLTTLLINHQTQKELLEKELEEI